MPVKKRLIKEIHDLPPEDLMAVCGMVLDLKEKKRIPEKIARPACLEVQEILKKCPGSLSDDSFDCVRIGYYFPDTSDLVKFFHREEGTDFDDFDDMIFMAADDSLLIAARAIGAETINPLSGPQIFLP